MVASNACSSFNLDEAISILAKQQFYFGQDRIYGRIKSISVKIKGSGLVVHRLITTLLNDAPLLYELKFEDYLKKICGIIELIDFISINSQFTQKSSMLKPFTKENLPIIITLLVSDVLSALRVPAFDEVKNMIKKNAKSAFKSEAEMESYFDKLCSLNNPHLSLLENLSFLEILSRAFHFKRVQRVIAIQITKHVNFAIESLIGLKQS
jgi:hypothetical protein